MQGMIQTIQPTENREKIEGLEDQEWVKDKGEYREEFPTLGGKGKRRQTQYEAITGMKKEDFPSFDIRASDSKKKPIKFSDNQSSIMKKENQRQKQTQMSNFMKHHTKPGGDSRFTMMEAKAKVQQQRFLNSIGHEDTTLDEQFQYSTSDVNYSAINQIQAAKNDSKQGKKGKKPKGAIVCETTLTEEQLNEEVELVRDVSDERPKKKKGKDQDTYQWNK